MIIAIDFDGTIVERMFPEIGAEVPRAFDYLQEFQKRGARLILHTIRSDAFPTIGASPSPEILVHDGRMYLSEAVEFCRVRGVEFWGINNNPEQHTWSQSPKSYAHLYIDDAAFGVSAGASFAQDTLHSWIQSTLQLRFCNSKTLC